MIKNWDWKLMIVLSIINIIFLFLYSYVLYNLNIIPLGGKKAPSFIFVLITQWYLIYRFDKKRLNQGVHFLYLFLYQYVFLILTGILTAICLYFYFNTESGKIIMDQYISFNLAQVQQFKAQILQTENQEFVDNLVQGIKEISPYSISKDDVSVKIALGFLPNLLISLYYKKG